MKKALFILTVLFSFSVSAQVFEFESEQQDQHYQHRILMDDDYIIETIYQTNPPKFILTRGGFYDRKDDQLVAVLEFNSHFEKDSLREYRWDDQNWNKRSKKSQVLDGKWLMAGRVTPDGEQRRNISRPRKTQKLLVDGFFQWTAFNTETMQFYGSGGGAYRAQDGTYTENIDYFSRDNSRVGMALSFLFNRQGKDWYHQGKSSKGKPMHEIWTERPEQ